MTQATQVLKGAKSPMAPWASNRIGRAPGCGFEVLEKGLDGGGFDLEGLLASGGSRAHVRSSPSNWIAQKPEVCVNASKLAFPKSAKSRTQEVSSGCSSPNGKTICF